MTDAEIIARIVKQRGRFRSKDKIAQGLAKLGRFDYYKSLRIVENVESQYERKIGLRQLPIVLLIGIPSLVVGVAFLYIGLASLIGGGVSIWGSIRRMQFRAVAIGLGLIMGSLWGIWQAVKKLF